MAISHIHLTRLKEGLFSKRIALANSLFGLVILYNLLALTVALLPADPVKIENSVLFINNVPIKSIPHISQLHLFGVYQMNNAALLPVAQSGLTLQGIFYTNPPENSQAIIAPANGDAKVFKPGDSINGIIIKQILPNDVVLENGGILQRLPLIRPELQMN